jgi:hypothetical protein
MSAATLNLSVEQYASFTGTLTLTDAATALPSDVGGVTARMAIVAFYGRPPLITLDSNGNGLVVHDSIDHSTDATTVTITLTGLQTAAMTVPPSATVIPPRQNYYYDLILEYPSGLVTRLVQGTLSVAGGATSD